MPRWHFLFRITRHLTERRFSFFVPLCILVWFHSGLLSGQIPAAHQTDRYLPILKGKTIGLVVNHTSLIGTRHVADSLLALGVQIGAIFGPEHGYRGTAPDGQSITDSDDPFSGIPVISLYGKKKQPAPEDLKELDLMVIDMQDVGTRFYTYISTMHLVMEACALQDIPVVILDRPNPNGHFVDGPILEPAFTSFVGMHPIPAVHGLTIGELALMINGEGWLGNRLTCDLTVIPCLDYTHSSSYTLPVKPSPNLPDMLSVYLYPTLCFFEGTTFSVGRGTDRPFQKVGHPAFREGQHVFTPVPNSGSAFPKHEGLECRGLSFSQIDPEQIRQRGLIDVQLILDLYHALPDTVSFFRDDGYFDLLAGTDTFRKQIESGTDEETIRHSWQPGLETYRTMRTKYLLYPE